MGTSSVTQGADQVARKANKSNVVAYTPKKAARPAKEAAPASGVPRQDDTRVMALDLPDSLFKFEGV